MGHILNHSAVIITGNELPGGFKWVSEVWEDVTVPMEESPVTGSQEDPISSPLGSFQSLCSSQNSEEGMKGTKLIPFAHPLQKTRVLQFEDTLLEVDCRKFILMYESLLLEGKAGNLTDLTVGMVLAEKPPTWLAVIHGPLKLLIISSKAFQKKKKAEYDAQAKAKNLGLVKERE